MIVLQYNTMLAELEEKDNPSVKRCHLIFRILDEIVDHMGVFRELMQNIKIDLKGFAHTCRKGCVL